MWCLPCAKEAAAEGCSGLGGEGAEKGAAEDTREVRHGHSTAQARGAGRWRCSARFVQSGLSSSIALTAGAVRMPLRRPYDAHDILRLRCVWYAIHAA